MNWAQMGLRQRQTQEFKEAIVRKLLLRRNQTLEEFCNENNRGLSTVSRWKTEYANVPEMNHKKNKSKYSPSQILKILSETNSLSEEDLGLYLRKNGLHTNQLTEWRDEILALMNQPKVNLNKKDERDHKIKDLERNLEKKNAALAEVSALLILQKKINFFWPKKEGEDT